MASRVPCRNLKVAAHARRWNMNSGDEFAQWHPRLDFLLVASCYQEGAEEPPDIYRDGSCFEGRKSTDVPGRHGWCSVLHDTLILTCKPTLSDPQLARPSETKKSK